VSILEMDWNIDDALEVRFEEGMEKGIEKAILSAHKKGKSNKEISDLLDISEKEVEKIIKRNTRVRA
jgi:FixJ family two-component response regulator